MFSKCVVRGTATLHYVFRITRREDGLKTISKKQVGSKTWKGLDLKRWVIQNVVLEVKDIRQCTSPKNSIICEQIVIQIQSDTDSFYQIYFVKGIHLIIDS